jgi:diguanylate cyclase (GGDEF)-like protein
MRAFKQNIRTRIALFFVLLILAVQVFGLFIVRHSIYVNEQQRLAQLNIIFDQAFVAGRDRLQQYAVVAAADFGFRAAVAKRDPATIESALHNQQLRMRADLVFLVGVDHLIITDTSDGPQSGQPFAYGDLLARSLETGGSSAVAAVGHTLYELVAVPVRAPELIGYLVVGLAIDDTFARRLSTSTSLDLTFLGQLRDGSWIARASSLNPQQTAALVRAAGVPGDSTLDSTADILGEEFALRKVRVDSEGMPVVAVLQISLDKALAPFRTLQGVLLAVTVIACLASLFGSLVTARSITQPLKALSTLAENMATGDYSKQIEIKAAHEIEALAKTFNQMRAGLVQREGKILEIAYVDTVTRLPNRGFFLMQAQRALAEASHAQTPLAFFMLDLNRFKYVNDTYGHHIGDLLLRQVGTRLQETVRRTDDVVARLGGDEFAVLLVNSSVTRARQVAARMTEELGAPFDLDGQIALIGGSIGIVVFPEYGEDLDTLLRRADMAMYAVKREGGGYRTYDHTLEAGAA